MLRLSFLIQKLILKLGITFFNYHIFFYFSSNFKRYEKFQGLKPITIRFSLTLGKQSFRLNINFNP